MAGNSFGQLFKITTCGESHGGAIAVIVDGCPANLPLSATDIQIELDRRKPGQSHMTSPRHEHDTIHILSGLYEGKTTGTPLLLLAYNTDQRPTDYESLKEIYRPSHADFTYMTKYGIRDARGGGRASARETLARVAAGAIAKKILKQALNIEIFGYVEQIGPWRTEMDYQSMIRSDIETSIVRCPDPPIAHHMIQYIETMKKEGDSIGGIVKCIIQNMLPGLGEPVFDKLPADLGKAMLSINAVKGFEIGSGFKCAGLRGSEHHDLMTIKEGKPTFLSNHAGGTLGGISTGEDIYFSVAFKPPSSIRQPQQTINLHHEPVCLHVEGRHDPCIVPRAVPIVEAMAALVVMDHYLRHQARK